MLDINCLKATWLILMNHNRNCMMSTMWFAWSHLVTLHCVSDRLNMCTLYRLALDTLCWFVLLHWLTCLLQMMVHQRWCVVIIVVNKDGVWWCWFSNLFQCDCGYPVPVNIPCGWGCSSIHWLVNWSSESHVAAAPWVASLGRLSQPRFWGRFCNSCCWEFWTRTSVFRRPNEHMQAIIFFWIYKGTRADECGDYHILSPDSFVKIVQTPLVQC